MKRIALVCVALHAAMAGAATFLVPSDETLVRAAKAIVIATPGSAYSRYAPGGWIETVTTMRVDEAIKGDLAATIEVTELGGTVNGMTYVVPGSPQYAPGERVLLFLETNDRGEWVAKNMVVGKFTFDGSHLVRDSSELVGWDVDSGVEHREPLRDAARFLRYVRDVAAGRAATADYILPRGLLQSESLKPVPQAASPTTYLLQIGNRGLRWNRFPTTVTFLSHGTQPGALGGGLTSLQRGLGAWSAASGANIRYAYGGTTPVSATHLCSGCGGPDGVNSVQFNDPSNEIPGSFQLASGATLAVGGAWTDGTTHIGPAGETFLTIVEADLVVQDGIGGSGISGPGFDHVLTHELGHTLGLRHSDEPPPGGTSTSLAIMNSSVDFNNDSMGSTLQAWDLEAVDAVYGSGGGVNPPPCNPPTITAQPQSTSTINTPVNLTVTASGDAPLQYQWFIGSTGNASQPAANGNSAQLTVQPAVTTQYWVRVTNSCGSANSATVTVTVNGCPAVVINSLSLSTLIIQGKTTTLTASATGGSGLTFQWFIGNPGDTTTRAAAGSSITVQPNTTTTYWVRATNSCGAFADSDVVVVTVQPCTAPTVIVQPASGDVFSGSSMVLFVADSGSKPETYQWFQGAAGDTSNPAPNASFPSFTTPVLSTSTSFWVRITNDCGTTDSAVAQLNVVPSCRAAAITSQPQSQSVGTGSSAILHVGATGTTLLYQWYQGAVLDFTRPIGGSSPTLITPAINAPSQFWVRVTSPCGSANSVTVTVTPNARRRPSRG